MDSQPTDPLTSMPIAYGTDVNLKQFQLANTLESGLAVGSANYIIQSAYAADNQSARAYVS
jgi:hypothetical protein